MKRHPNAVKALSDPRVMQMLADDPNLSLKLMDPQFRKDLYQDPKMMKAREEYIQKGTLSKDLPKTLKQKANPHAQPAPTVAESPDVPVLPGEYQTEIDYLSSLGSASKATDALGLPPPSDPLGIGTSSDYPF